jgi:predicted esterase
MQKHYFTTSKTARYFTLGNEHAETVWFVCHGYGQLAEYFIKNFEGLDPEKNFIIAPEALSRFYLEGFSGRVGAAWMTKEEREPEVIDYINYLNSLYDLLLKRRSDVKINILGFSQGVPAVCRWVADGKVKFDKLILWAGIFPPDLNSDFSFTIENLLKDKLTYIVYGRQDQFLKEEHLVEIEKFKLIKPELKVLIYEGKHEINKEILERISIE